MKRRAFLKRSGLVLACAAVGGGTLAATSHETPEEKIRYFVYNFIANNGPLLRENRSSFCMSARTCGALMDYDYFRPFDERRIPLVEKHVSSAALWGGGNGSRLRRALLREETSIPETFTFFGFPVIECGQLHDGVVEITDRGLFEYSFSGTFLAKISINKWKSVWLKG